MRLLRWILCAVILAFPALAETNAPRFPFSVDAGTHRNIVLPALGGSAVRLVFPEVGVERPSDNRAILKPGGDGRVIFQVTPEGEATFRTGAIIHFGQAPLIMERKDGQIAMAGSLKALSLPLVDGPDSPFGTITFEAMSFKLFLPSGASPAIQEAGIAVQAKAMHVDPSLLAVAQPGEWVRFDAVDLRARTTGRIVENPADIGQLFGSILQVDLDNASANLSDGRIMAHGIIDLSESNIPRIDGLLSLGSFATLLQTLMSGGSFAPERIMPFALVAGTLGRMTDDGTLNFRIQTTGEGTLILNGRPAALDLGQ